MLPGSDPPTLHYHRLQSSPPQENFLIDLQKCSSPSSSPPSPLWCHLQRSLSLPPFSKKFIPPFTAHQIRERCTSTPPSLPPDSIPLPPCTVLPTMAAAWLHLIIPRSSYLVSSSSFSFPWQLSSPNFSFSVLLTPGPAAGREPSTAAPA